MACAQTACAKKEAPAHPASAASVLAGGCRAPMGPFASRTAHRTAEALVATCGLTKRYGEATVVSNVDLAVPQGVVYGFLGPNGAGKSTTMKMLLGLVHPSAGTVTMFGRAFTDGSRLDILRNVGSLIESPSCYPHLTARENLEIIRQLRGLPVAEIDEVLGIVRLDDRATLRKRVGHFSLGMKQRLGIAAALMGKPRLLLLDEPTNGLDPSGIHEIRALIRSLPERFGMTVVVSSHLLSEIDQIANHVGIIRRGQMVFQGTMEGLHARARRWIFLRTTDDARAAALLAEWQVPMVSRAAAGSGGAADLEADRGSGASVTPSLALQQLDDAVLAQLSLRLAHEGIGIVRMEECGESLEDIFLQMTGRGASL